MTDHLEVSPSGEPKYAWYADHLRRQIAEGALKPGDRLPSRTAVRALHHITQPTIEKAQSILEREGLIVRRERLGVFVAETGSEEPPGPDIGSGAGDTIGILAHGEGEVKPGHRQPGWSDFIAQGALAACRESGKHALFLNPARLHGAELERLLARPPLGFVLASLPTSLDYDRLQALLAGLGASQQPLAVFGNESGMASFDRVACDHSAGCYQLTQWLIGRGCRRILPFWPPLQDSGNWLAERLDGYRRAMYDAGLEPLEVREVPQRHLPADPDNTREKFHATVRHKAGYLADYLARERQCDAILDVSDGDVPTTAAACRLLGYDPNKDVQIAGYDNYWRDTLEMSFEPAIPVATVDKHNWQVGVELVRLLLSRIAGELDSAPQLRWVQPELLPLDPPSPAIFWAAVRERGA